jgi:hypothetical protein
MKNRLAVLFVLWLPAVVLAQGVDIPPRHIIDMPTAGLLRRGGFDITVRFYGQSGVNLAMDVGVSRRFMFGTSFGGTEVLGEKRANWNAAPGVLVKYQLLSESLGWPGVTIGLETQGYGAYDDSTKRYWHKSMGAYIAGSKSYDVLERLDFHAGLNYSLERGDKDKDPNLFLGMTLAVNRDIEFLAEYDLAFNDDGSTDSQKQRRFGDGRGYLNTGIRINVKDVLYLEFFLKDMFQSRPDAEAYNREFKITYFQFIL